MRWYLVVVLALSACAPTTQPSADAGPSDENSTPDALSSPWNGTPCSYSVATSDTHCGCNFQSPVSLGGFPQLQFWPFGVHAQSGHTDGHRGLDFTVNSIDGNPVVVPVYSPDDGTVIDISNTQDSDGRAAGDFVANPLNHFTKLHLDCNVLVMFIPLTLLPEIVDGMAAHPEGLRVRRGQQLGTLPQAFHAHNNDCGPQHDQSCPMMATHYEVDVDPENDPAQYAVCPSVFLNPAEQATVLSMVAGSQYPEVSPRSVPIQCEAGGSIMMNYGAEASPCNERLPAELHAQLAACIPSRANWIW